MKQQFILKNDWIRQNAIRAIQSAPEGQAVTISEPNRTIEQNSAQWPILQAFSDQLVWPVNGAMVQLSPDEWKDILTAAFRQEQPRLAQGINGGVVMLGQRTSKFSKKEFSEWMEFLWSVAADRGVVVYPEENKVKRIHQGVEVEGECRRVA